MNKAQKVIDRLQKANLGFTITIKGSEMDRENAFMIFMLSGQPFSVRQQNTYHGITKRTMDLLKEAGIDFKIEGKSKDLYRKQPFPMNKAIAITAIVCLVLAASFIFWETQSNINGMITSQKCFGSGSTVRNAHQEICSIGIKDKSADLTIPYICCAN